MFVEESEDSHVDSAATSQDGFISTKRENNPHNDRIMIEILLKTY